MLAVRSPTDQATNTMEHRAPMYKSLRSGTVDVEVTIVQGSEFNESHSVTGRVRKSSYFVELGLDDVKEKTSGRKAKTGQHDCQWDETFIFTAYQSSRKLTLKLYCKHVKVGSDHIIGEAIRDFWDIPRYQNVSIDLHDPVKSHVSAKITLCLKVAATVTFSAGPPTLDLRSLYSLNKMTKIIESLSNKDSNKLSPAWVRFIQSLDIVASNARKISELHPPVQMALGAVAFALKAVLDGIARDERIDNMVGIMGDLHAYIADTYSIVKIAFYKDSLRRVLVQTTECSYFIGDYRRVTQFAQRAVVNLVSNADEMIQKFEDTFRDLKIGLILGSSLQTTIFCCLILQKVENIETMMYIAKLKPLEYVGWARSRTCLRGTRNAIINDLIQWASDCAESGTNNKSQIYVLQGPPDCGKSSIAHSVAEAFHLQDRLGAAIFLDDRADGKIIGSQKISTTIASQLADYHENIRVAISAKIKVDASLAEADIARQFPDLIVSATEGLALIGPICIVVDGLENIANPTEQLQFSTAIADHFNKLPSNFRLVLTACHGSTSEDIKQLLPDCIIKEITFDDEGTIVDYNKHLSQSLRHLFSKKLEIAERYTIDKLQDEFVKRSKGVYFWVSTARQFLLLCTYGDECKILQNILSTEPPRTAEVAMSQLFRAILSYIPYIPLICQSLIRSPQPLPLQSSPNGVSVLVSGESTYQSPFLNMMQNLAFIIENGRDGTDNPLFGIHPCLEDFLTSSRRCHGTDFYVDRLAPSLSMVEICFDLMARLLRQNICTLDDPMALNEEIPNRDNRIRQCIPIILQDTCRNWIFHLEAFTDGKWDSIDSVLERLDTFLSKHLLHWIECMSLLGWVDVILNYLRRLSAWLKTQDIPPRDNQYVLILDALQFIHAFAPIISKAAMQTYYSALPLMPSASPLCKKYSAMSRPSLKLSGSCYSQIRIINHPGVMLPKCLYHTTSSDDIIALSLCESGIAFFDTRTGNEIGSRIPTPDFGRYLIAFSPDGKSIVIQGDHERALGIWNVETCTRVKTIQKESGHSFECITYSANGEKVMVVTRSHHLSRRRLVFIWDVKTDKPLKQLVVQADDVALSPDGSQIATNGQLGIQIVDISTEHICRQITPYNDDPWIYNDPNARIVWSPNGQFLASASAKRYKTTEIYLWSLTGGSDQVPSLTLVLEGSTKSIVNLACSPDSSKIVAALWDYEAQKMTLAIWCTRSGVLVGTTSFESTMREVTLSFAADGQDILIRAYDSVTSPNPILLRFSVLVPTPYMDHPPKFYPSQAPHIIQYSHHISGAIEDYASHVDSDGWILDTKGKREIWTPWANYELLCSCKPPQEGQTQYRTLEVKDPETKTVVLIYVIAFEQEDVNNEIQEAAASVE